MSVIQKLKNKVRSKSIHVSYVNVGSCNGCDIEILACLSPRYDLEQYGIYAHNNPREADVLLITGALCEQWDDKLVSLWEKIPEPKAAITIGNCPVSGCVFNRRGSYVNPPVSKHIPIAASIPGCPPRPSEIVSTILSIAPEVFKDFEEKGKKEKRKEKKK